MVSTTYATRDLAAILYRARTYDFDKAIYVTLMSKYCTLSKYLKLLNYWE